MVPRAQRTQGTKRLSPEDVASMRDLLTHNMYQVRQRVSTAAWLAAAGVGPSFLLPLPHPLL